MGESKIEWTDYTFNPWYGCQKVSPACDNCYAEAWGRRTGLMPYWGGSRRLAANSTRATPFRWNRLAGRDGVRPRVFTLSLGDFFDNKVPPVWRDEAWDTIRACSNLDWLILTKRPQNIDKMLPTDWGVDGWSHVWLGATVENKEEALRRLPALLAIPAIIHWVSAEPLLGQLDLRPWLQPAANRVDWVISGGETGNHRHARPSEELWFRDLRDQCAEANATFFMKQLTQKSPIPVDLMVRNYPTIGRKHRDAGNHQRTLSN